MDTDKTKERYAVLTDTMMKMQTQDKKERQRDPHRQRHRKCTDISKKVAETDRDRQTKGQERQEVKDRRRDGTRH